MSGEIVIIDEKAPDEITISDVGVQGASAGEGPPFRFEQHEPAARWTVNHQRHYRPSSIRVTDSAGDELDDFWIENETDDQFDLVFSGAFSGEALVK